VLRTNYKETVAMQRKHGLIVIGLFIAGFGAYVVWPIFSPRYLPANPGAIFAIAAAINLLSARTAKSYWVTVAISSVALLYPLFVARWMDLAERPLVDVLFVHGTPALLLCLLLLRSVRTLVDQEVRENQARAEEESRALGR